MSEFSLINLSEMGGDKYLFLAPASFTKFAFDLPQKFAPSPMKKPSNSMSVKIPQEVQDDFAPLLTSPLPSNINITIGSAENDAYMNIMQHVEVFDTYVELMEYAINNGWSVDEKNGFDGMIY